MLHTPGPWVVDRESDRDYAIHADSAKGWRHIGWAVASTGGSIPVHEEEAEANAHFICRACNCHDALLEACRRALPHVPRGSMEYSEGDHGDRVYIRDLIEAAIAKATK